MRIIFLHIVGNKQNKQKGLIKSHYRFKKAQKGLVFLTKKKLHPFKAKTLRQKGII